MLLVRILLPFSMAARSNDTVKVGDRDNRNPQQEPIVEAPAEDVTPVPEPEPVAEAEPYAPFAGSEDTARTYAVATEFEAPAAPEPPPAVEDTVTEAAEEALAAEEPFGGENDVWESIRNAGAEDDTPAAEPDAPAEDPAAPAQRPAPVFGSGIFSGSMSDLSRYRSTETEAAPEPTCRTAAWTRRSPPAPSV